MSAQFFRQPLNRLPLVFGILAFIILCGATTNAQVAVTATAGTPAGAYTTLQTAFAAINAGTHQGAITIKITGSTAETATATLCAKNGTTATQTGVAAPCNINTPRYDSVLIQPVGAATVTTSLPAGLATPLISLNGASSVTIDGLNDGINSLTINNPSTSGTNGTSTIRLIDGAKGNTITNATISGAAATSTTTANILIAGSTLGVATAAAAGNSNNTITNNIINASLAANGYATGIVSSGAGNTTGLLNDGNKINNNTIQDFFRGGAGTGGTGASLSSNTSNYQFNNNTLTLTTTQSATAACTLTGVASVGAAGVNTINGNTFSGFAITCPSVQARALNVSAAAATGSLLTVDSNKIYNFTLIDNLTTGADLTTTGFIGIGVTGNLVNVTNNTIGSQDGTNPITVTISNAPSVTNFGLSVGINLTGTGAAVASNQITGNTIGSITVNAPSPATAPAALYGGFVGINVGITTIATYNLTPTTTNTLTISGNTIGAPSPFNNNIQTSGTSATLQGIRLAAGGGVSNVSNNTIQNLTSSGANSTVFISTSAPTATASVIGIANNSNAGSQNVAQNTVRSLSNTSTTGAVNVIGIYNAYFIPTAEGTPRTNTIQRNFIHSLTAANSAATVSGIYATQASPNASAGFTNFYQNNMIRLGIDKGGNQITTGNSIGVNLNSGTSATTNYSAVNQNIYNNTVYVGGSSANNTAAFDNSGEPTFTGAGSPNTRDVRNNIFVNDNSVAGTVTVGANLGSYTTTGFTSNYNIYHNTKDANGQIRAGVTNYSLLNWKSASSQDANSRSPVALNDIGLVNPGGTASLLYAVVDLHIQSPSIATNVGTTIAAVTDDFDGQARPIPTGTSFDIGADEITQPPTAAAVSIVGQVKLSNGRGIVGVRVQLTDANGERRFATSSLGGYYRFDNVPAGAIYVINATSKRFVFRKATQTLNAINDVNTVNFIADKPGATDVNHQF